MLIHFKTVKEARQALLHDKLGTVYKSAETVFIATALGTGTFSLTDWLKFEQDNDVKPNSKIRTSPRFTRS